MVDWERNWRGNGVKFFESTYCGGSDLADWNHEELASSWRPEPATLIDLLGGLMDDSQIHGSIENLVAEEHELWNRESDGAASDDDRRRLEQIRVSLDQCWDLLRQRRARRDAGQDPDTAVARDTNVVERYEQ